jgi:hypothetical protein
MKDISPRGHGVPQVNCSGYQTKINSGSEGKFAPGR